VRTRLATLTLATLLILPAWAAPALADQGPATVADPGSAHGLATASGSGSGGSDRGPGGAGSGTGVPGSGSRRSGSGSGGPGSDDRRSPTGTSPRHSDSSQRSDSRPGLRGGPEPDTRARASAAEPAPPVGSVADRREGFPRLSTPPGLAAVAGVAGGVLLLVALVAAGFRARARLGRLG
jgi:hypothetical protein